MNDSFLQEQGVSGALIESVRKFRESYPVAEGLENRMSTPEIPFFGKEILEMAIAALLQGENVLSVHHDRSACRAIQPAQHVQQRGFAGSGCADNCNKFALLYT